MTGLSKTRRMWWATGLIGLFGTPIYAADSVANETPPPAVYVCISAHAKHDKLVPGFAVDTMHAALSGALKRTNIEPIISNKDLKQGSNVTIPKVGKVSHVAMTWLQVPLIDPPNAGIIPEIQTTLNWARKKFRNEHPSSAVRIHYRIHRTVGLSGLTPAGRALVRQVEKRWGFSRKTRPR